MDFVESMKYLHTLKMPLNTLTFEFESKAADFGRDSVSQRCLALALRNLPALISLELRVYSNQFE